jgi:uncharacterized protein DUF3105
MGPNFMANRRRRARTRTTARTPAPRKAGWRQTIDSFGGFTVIGGLGLAVLALIWVIVGNPIGFSQSDDPLLGEAVTYETSTHLTGGATLGPNPVLTPAGGLHDASPLRAGNYDDPVSDGNAIHSLEHGFVWITYQPDQISDAELDTLEDIASDFGRDTILSPRLENAFPIIIVSWEQRLTQTTLDELVLRDFVSTNRNRSPEPGIR